MGNLFVDLQQENASSANTHTYSRALRLMLRELILATAAVLKSLEPNAPDLRILHRVRFGSEACPDPVGILVG
jgi:hypothetical protein